MSKEAEARELQLSLLGCHNILGARVCVPRTLKDMSKWAERIGNDPTCRNDGGMRCLGGSVFVTCISGSWVIRRVCGAGTLCRQDESEKISCVDP